MMLKTLASPPPPQLPFSLPFSSSVAVAKTAEPMLVSEQTIPVRGGSPPLLPWATHSVRQRISPEVEHADGTHVIKYDLFF